MTLNDDSPRPKRVARAHRAATPEETDGWILDTLRWAPCAMTVPELVDKALDDWGRIPVATARASINRLAAQGKIEDRSNGAQKLWGFKKGG